MRRRAVLATLGTGVFAGCSSISALGGKKFKKASLADAVGNAKKLHIGDKNEMGQTAKVTLKKGRYMAAGFALSVPFDFKMTGQVMKNGPIDIYLMTISQLEKFERKPNLVNATVEVPDVESIDVNEKVPAGKYQLVLDNTFMGEAKPSGTAEVEFKVEMIGRKSPTTTTTEEG